MKGFRIHPLVLIIQMLCISTLSFTLNEKPVLLVFYIYIFILLLLVKNWKGLIVYTSVIILSLILEPVLIKYAANQNLIFFYMILYTSLRLMPVIGGFIFLVEVLKIRELVQFLNLIRVPENLIISLSVTLHYVPAIFYEYRMARNSLKFRSLFFWEKWWLVLIPLVIRSLRIGEELTASALTKGVESKCKNCYYRKISFRFSDALILSINLFIFTGFVVFNFFVLKNMRFEFLL